MTDTKISDFEWPWTS